MKLKFTRITKGLFTACCCLLLMWGIEVEMFLSLASSDALELRKYFMLILKVGGERSDVVLGSSSPVLLSVVQQLMFVLIA